MLLRSIDDGRTWTSLPIPTKGKLIDVAFVSEQVGWITGFSGEILGWRARQKKVASSPSAPAC